MADSTTTPTSNNDGSPTSAINITDRREAHQTSSNAIIGGVDNLVTQSVPIPIPSTIGNITTTVTESANLEDFSTRSIKSEPGVASEPTCSIWGTSNYQTASIDSTELANMQQYLQYPTYNRYDPSGQQNFDSAARCSSQDGVTTNNAEDPMLSRDVGADMDDINNPFYTVPAYSNMFINQQPAYSAIPYGDTSQKHVQSSQLPPYFENVKKACDVTSKAVNEDHVSSCRPKLEHDTDGINIQPKKVIVPAGEKHEHFGNIDAFKKYISTIPDIIIYIYIFHSITFRFFSFRYEA